jgi:hypothetical protein
VSVAEYNSPETKIVAHEGKIVLLFCLLAAIHVFVFSATFPFYCVVDEQAHFDLAVRYSQGKLPRSLAPPCDEALPYIVIFSTPEFLWVPTSQPGGIIPPPPWKQPVEKVRETLLAKQAGNRKLFKNYEAASPPMYYSLAGAWWRLGKWFKLDGGQLLYWLRFLNVPLVSALVWLGWRTARKIFPENNFVCLAVPGIIAFMPQTTFYTINNDVLSPICFGAAFICLIKLLRTEVPDFRLGIFTGLALAATFLTKISNLPLLAVSAAVILFKVAQLARAGKLRAAFPSLAALALCAGLPMAAWLAWCKHAFGDFTGTASKIQFLGWTHKPFAEWWHHPIFTPHGFWIFIHDLLATFWQGEFLWHRQPLALPGVDLIYVLASIVLIIIALPNLLPRSKYPTAPQRQALWFCFACFAAAVAFLGFLSLIYDFQDCFYPSREHPYFSSGRLMLGALIPFLLLFVYGLDRALKNFGNAAKFSALAGFILFMVAAEITIDWPVFPNPYNWFHM